MHHIIHILIVGGFLAAQSKAFGWGAKGHDVVAQLATKVYAEKYSEAKPYQSFSKVLLGKSQMLGHLANVPDVYWKSLPRNITSVLNPSHYVDIEYVSGSAKLDEFPVSLERFVESARKMCIKSGLSKRIDCNNADDDKIIATTGSAQFRVEQLAKMMELELKALAKLQKLSANNKQAKDRMPKEQIAHIDQALLFAGIMAHFVGDLGQPFHTTVDYDGWMSGQGGIHSYFEVDLVNVLSSSWEDDVLQFAKTYKPANTIETMIKKDKKTNVGYLTLAIGLALDSYKEKDRSLYLDKSHAIQKIKKEVKSEKGVKRKPRRNNPRIALPYFKQILKERFAVASDMLANIWHHVYVNAGSPSFDGYHSYNYPLKPEPIWLDYIKATFPAGK